MFRRCKKACARKSLGRDERCEDVEELQGLVDLIIDVSVVSCFFGSLNKLGMLWLCYS